MTITKQNGKYYLLATLTTEMVELENYKEDEEDVILEF